MSEEETIEKNFDWDGNSETIDFFGENTKVETTTEVTEKVEKDDLEVESEETSEETTTEITEEEEIINVQNSMFEETSEENDTTTEEVSEEDNEEKEETVTVSSSTGALEYLKEKGVLNYELEEGTEMTEELASEILEDKFDEGIEDRVGELMKDLPDVVKEINKFAIAGGDVQKFFDAMIKPKIEGASFDAKSDIEDVVVQEAVIRFDLKREGFDDKYINSQIEFLKDSNNLETSSKKKFDKFVETDKLATKNLADNQVKIKAADKEKAKQHKISLINTVKNVKDVNGMVFTEVEKDELPSYMSDRNIKLKGNQGSITSMQKDLYSALQNPNKSLVIAKLLKNDFDFTEFSTDANTRVARNVKEKLQNNKKKPNKSGTGKSSTKKRNLSDYF